MIVINKPIHLNTKSRFFITIFSDLFLDFILLINNLQQKHVFSLVSHRDHLFCIRSLINQLEFYDDVLNLIRLIKHLLK